MKTRYRKIIRDLTSDVPKNAMLVFAIAIGVFGVGTILGGYAVLEREMARNYRGTNPASATIKIDGASFERSLVDSVARLDGIARAERHATLSVRMKIGEQWYPMLLNVVDDFSTMRTNTVAYVSGAAVPPTGTMLAERTAHRVMHTEDGKNIIIKTPMGKPIMVRIAGTVHDPGLAPAWQEQCGYGYVSLATLHLLGETQGFDELRITVTPGQRSLAAITQKAKQISAFLEQRGYRIHEVQIPPPDRHPHQGQMNAVLLLFTVFSFLLLVLSSILVSTSIATLMVRQVREIGIMKTIGATSRQVALLYLAMIAFLCILASAVAIPSSRHAAVFFAGKISLLLNLTIFDGSVPFWVFLVQLLSGILIPLIAAVIPAFRGSRVSVRKAMTHYGVSENNGGKESFLVKLTKLLRLGETFALSVRNVFRQRSRLVMTLGLLSAGGAMFITALNVSKAWDANLQKITQQRFYDLDVRFHQPLPPGTFAKKAASVGGIRAIEEWSYSSTSFITDVPYDIVSTYPDKGHGSFLIVVVPLPTTMMKLPVKEGAWLDSESANDVVLNHMAHALAPQLRVGDSVSLSLENIPVRWRIVGIVEDLYSPATAYVPFNAFQRASGSTISSNMLRLTFADRDPAGITRKIHVIEETMNREHISILQLVPITNFRNAIGEHMGVLVSSLIAMAVLMGLVGTLGLTSTMSMSIMERTREIGVMRAIGATPRIIRRLVVTEGLLIGVLSIGFAIVLSLLLSYYLGLFLGSMAFRSPLDLTVSIPAVIGWICIIVLGSIIATLYPARRASGITTREALAYE